MTIAGGGHPESGGTAPPWLAGRGRWVEYTALGWFVCLGVGLAPRLTGGAPPPERWRLTVELHEQGTLCSASPADDEPGPPWPLVRDLRSRVVQLLGRDPFDPPGSRELQVGLALQGPILQARIRLVEPDGWVAGERLIRTRTPDCTELFGAVALALAIVIDPLQGFALAPPQPARLAPPGPPPAGPPVRTTRPLPAVAQPQVIGAEPALAAPPVASPPFAPPTPPPTGTPWRWDLGGGLSGSWGDGPALTPGLALITEYTRERWSLALEGRWDRMTESATGLGAVAAGLRLGSLIPCRVLGSWEFCGLASFGVLQAEGRDLPESRADAAWLGAVGARVGHGVPLTARLRLEFWLDARLALRRVALQVGEEAVWRNPPGSLGLGLGLRGDLAAGPAAP